MMVGYGAERHHFCPPAAYNYGVHLKLIYYILAMHIFIKIFKNGTKGREGETERGMEKGEREGKRKKRKKD